MDGDRIDPARTKATIQRSLDKAKDRRIDMTDIVETLRKGGPCEVDGVKCVFMEATSNCYCAIAADEIERLRGVVINLSVIHMKLTDDNEQLHEDVRRLRVEAGYD